MLLAIDVGNTDTVFGVFECGELIKILRVPTQLEQTIDQYGLQFENIFKGESFDAGVVEAVIAASVVPIVDSVLSDTVEQYFSIKPIFVSSENAGISILYDDPSEVGADRIVNAVAAVERYGVPAIIVDMGTATTFDGINKNGAYLGGLIAPGMEISALALADRAARLPRVKIQKTENLIGSSTEASMQSGFFWGYVSLVDGIIERMKGELGGNAQVIATGGMASFIKEESKWVSTIDQNLTLDGLYLVAQRLGIA